MELVYDVIRQLSHFITEPRQYDSRVFRAGKLQRQLHGLQSRQPRDRHPVSNWKDIILINGQRTPHFDLLLTHPKILVNYAYTRF